MNKVQVYILKIGTKCRNTNQRINFTRVKILEFLDDGVVKVAPVNINNEIIETLIFFVTINQLY